MTRLNLHVNAVGAVMGGATRHLQPFLEALVEARPDWQISVHVSEGMSIDGFPPAVSVHAVPRRGMVRRLRWDALQLPRITARRRADVLLNVVNSGPIRSRIPSILYQRNPIYFDPAWVQRLSAPARAQAWLRRRLAFAQMRGAVAVITPSHAMAGYLRSWRALPSECRLVTIPHGVDTRRFALGRTPLPPSRRENLRILSVSHPAPHKGQETLLFLLAELRRRGIAARLKVTIGSAEQTRYAAKLHALSERLGLAEHVEFLGSVSDVETLYRAADIVVFPSLTESFGFPVVEAAGCGIPVVATAIPSTIELLEENAWYFAPGDASGAADAVDAVLVASEDSIAARTRAARRRVEELTWHRNARAVATLIEECSARSG